jgi:DNA polymerase III alpha subunit
MAQQISAANVVTTIEAAEKIGQRARIAGVRQTWRRTTTSSGDHLYFMGLDDLEGSITVVIGGDVYRRDRKEFSGGGPVVIEGLVEEDRNTGEPTLRAERAWRVE